MFIDKRHSSYSIHQIGMSYILRNKKIQIDLLVQMGHSEGKEIGQWFGPNTIAQVLRYE
jgi:cysteine protease ATG4